jgi:5'-3' exonuclease
MLLHLVDGTYELFRCFYGNRRSGKPDDGWGAVRLVLRTVLGMVEEGATHVGIATDHVIEPFRNALWPGYKTGQGVERALLAQFQPLEDALAAFGFLVWPMVELEADDALASAASAAVEVQSVEKICIWSPDKDLAQCVRGDHVVQVDRHGGLIRDEAAVKAKFGVPPQSIPDYLALVGDSADGYPGIRGWGRKSAAAVLLRYGHLANIPLDELESRGAESLRASWDQALLFLRLATLRTDAHLFDSVDALKWKGPGPDARGLAARMGAEALVERAEKAAAKQPQP